MRAKKTTKKKAAVTRAKTRAGSTRKRPNTQASNGRRRKRITVRRRRTNPDGAEAAAEIYETFHGKPSQHITVIEEAEEYPADVAELGRLVYLKVRANSERGMSEISGFGQCIVTCTPDGGQLYFFGGDQSIDLDALGLEDQEPKDHIDIGPCEYICYHTRKGFHDFQPIDYYHRFGEDRGTAPTLHYDTRNRRLYLTGGTYQVKPEGIVN